MKKIILILICFLPYIAFSQLNLVKLTVHALDSMAIDSVWVDSADFANLKNFTNNLDGLRNEIRDTSQQVLKDSLPDVLADSSLIIRNDSISDSIIRVDLLYLKTRTLIDSLKDVYLQLNGFGDSITARKLIDSTFLSDSLNLIAIKLLNNGYINVKDSGATGDGITDETTVFNNVLSACKNYNKNMYVPSGEYLLTDTLKIDTSIRIFGDGAASILLNNSTLPIIRIRTNSETEIIEIENLKIKGNRGTNNIGIQIRNSQNFKIRNIIFDSLAVGVLTDSVNYSLYDPCLIENTKYIDVKCGLKLLSRSEYIEVNGIGCYSSDTGIYYNGANVIFSNGILTDNSIAIYMNSSANGTKSSITNFEVTHNTTGIKINSLSGTFRINNSTFEANANNYINNASDLSFNNCRLNDSYFYWKYSSIIINNSQYNSESMFVQQYNDGTSGANNQLSLNNCIKVNQQGVSFPVNYDLSRVLSWSDSSYLHGPSAYLNIQNDEFKVNGKMTGDSLYVNGVMLVEDSAEFDNSLLVNPDFEYVNKGFTAYYGTISKENNAKFNATCLKFTNYNQYGQFYQNISGITSGHIYYAGAWAKPGNNDSLSIRLATAWLGTTLDTEDYSDLTHDTWTLVSVQDTATTTGLGIVIYPVRPDNGFANATTYFDGFILLDLTDIYGGGSEPSKAEMDAVLSNYSVDYNKIIRKINTPLSSYITSVATDTSFFDRSGNFVFLKNLTDSVIFGGTTPSEKFQVTGKSYFNGNIGINAVPSTYDIYNRKDQNTATGLHIYNNTNGSGAKAGIKLQGNGTIGTIEMLSTGYSSSNGWKPGDMNFDVNNATIGFNFKSSSTGTKWFRITNDSINSFIGGVKKMWLNSYGLHIKDTVYVGESTLKIYSKVDSGYYNSGVHIWEIDGTEKMRIDANGNFGIGTTDPTKKLDVNGTTILMDTLFHTMGGVSDTIIVAAGSWYKVINGVNYKIYTQADTASELATQYYVSQNNDNYLKQDGTTALTGNWDAGNYNITMDTCKADNINITNSLNLLNADIKYNETTMITISGSDIYINENNIGDSTQFFYPVVSNDLLKVKNNVYADSFKFNVPDTGYYSISPSLFKSQYTGSGLDSMVYTILSTTTKYDDVSIICPVNLPHGATVIDVIIKGDSDAEAKTWNMYRVDFGSSSSSMASATVNTSDNTISNATIDNKNYCYIIIVALVDIIDEIHGGIITYIISDL